MCMKNKIIICIPGAGGSPEKFKSIYPSLERQGYSMTGIDIHDTNNPLKTLTSITYPQYRRILKNKIEYLCNEGFEKIEFLTFSHGSSVAVNYLIKEKEIPKEITRVTCMAPALSYFAATDFPKSIQKYGKTLSRILYEISEFTRVGNYRLNMVDLGGAKVSKVLSQMHQIFPQYNGKEYDKDARIQAILSYIHHSFSLYDRSQELPIKTRLYFPKSDNLFKSTSEERIQRAKKILLKDPSKPDKMLSFHEYPGELHDGWLNVKKFDEIFPNGF